MLISIETHITCDFPGGGRGSGPPIPPLDPHMHKLPVGLIDMGNRETVSPRTHKPKIVNESLHL